MSGILDLYPDDHECLPLLLHLEGKFGEALVSEAETFLRDHRREERERWSKTDFFTGKVRK